MTSPHDYAVAFGGATGRAALPMRDEQRRGYRITDVIPAFIQAHTTPESSAAFHRFIRYGDTSDVVWYADWQGRYRWTTQRRLDIERAVTKATRKRERGIRGSMAMIARSLGVNVSTLSRVIETMVGRGLLLVRKSGLGRYSRTSIIGLGSCAVNQSTYKHVGLIDWIDEGISDEEAAEIVAMEHAVALDDALVYGYRT
jgi:DNA-binding MarR family transcriptional regulator